MSKYYITTPIYYVNDAPHIGSAYTTVACDVIARFMRLSGADVKFLTGTDEHGQKVEKAAHNAHLSPKEFVDKVSIKFRDLCSLMNCSNDDFIRTTEERHIKAAKFLWTKLKEKGHIYLGAYEGWYSVRDEAFYAQSELTEDGLAPTGASVEWISEPSYFFDLSKWQDNLLDFYDKNPNFIRPISRRNEVINFVKSGLEDLSISRTSFKWGIPVPGDEGHVMYVWMDALVNYISALGYPDDLVGDYKKYWPADVHVIGKDITRFHAVYWPAFLMAADIEPPAHVMSHGWWTNDGQKISKSLGNVIDPISLVKEFGVDQVRYFLIKEVNFGNDGNFSRGQLISRTNNELANKIGNLVQRTLSFVFKEYAATPNLSTQEIDELYDSEIIQFAICIKDDMDKAIEKYDISHILLLIMQLADMANSYIDKQAPWVLKNSDRRKMDHVLYVLIEVIRYIGIYLQPFVPESASKILDQISIEKDLRDFRCLSRQFAITPGREIQMPRAIFPRVDIN